MPLYKCDYCNYSTKIKQHFTKHNNTNKHRNRMIELGLITKEGHLIIQNNPAVIQNNPQIIQNNPTNYENNPPIIQNNPASKVFKCDFCPKTFTIHANKRRHEMYRCKENPDFLDKLISDKNNRIKNLEKDKESLKKYNEKLEAEKKELYKQVSTLLDKVGDTNIQNNIILNSYGKEDLSHITDALKTELLSIPYGAIPKMIEAIHFNDEKPENKNILLPNKKDNLVVLCKKCHDNVHHGNLVINGYKNGPSGKILDYYNEGTKKVQNKKYGVDQISIIKKMSNEKKTKKVILKELDEKHSIKIGLSTYNKIINNNY